MKSLSNPWLINLRNLHLPFHIQQVTTFHIKQLSMCVVKGSLSPIVIPSSLTSLADFTLIFYRKYNFPIINVWPKKHNLNFARVGHHTIDSKLIKNQLRVIRQCQSCLFKICWAWIYCCIIGKVADFCFLNEKRKVI